MLRSSDSMAHQLERSGGLTGKSSLPGQLKADPASSRAAGRVGHHWSALSVEASEHEAETNDGEEDALAAVDGDARSRRFGSASRGRR